MDKLKGCPPGLLKTLFWTQLIEAVKNDLGISLPEKTGQQIPELIDELIDAITMASFEPPDRIQREGEKLSEYLERIQPCPCCRSLDRKL